MEVSTVSRTWGTSGNDLEEGKDHSYWRLAGGEDHSYWGLQMGKQIYLGCWPLRAAA